MPAKYARSTNNKRVALSYTCHLNAHKNMAPCSRNRRSIFNVCLARIECTPIRYWCSYHTSNEVLLRSLSDTLLTTLRNQYNIAIFVRNTPRDDTMSMILFFNYSPFYTQYNVFMCYFFVNCSTS